MDLSKNIFILAGVYGDQFNVTINVNDRGMAGTDGNVIHIPKPKSGKEYLTWAYTCHEAGHVRDTDNDLVIATKKANGFLGWLLNVLEDTRMERNQFEFFPGAKRNFDRLFGEVKRFQLGRFEALDKEDLPSLLSAYVFYYVRGYLMQYPNWDEDCIKLQNYLNTRYNVLFMYSFNSLLDRVLTCESTKDCLDLSKEVYQYLKNAAEDEPEQGDSGSNDQQNEETQNDGSDVDSQDEESGDQNSDDNGHSGSDSDEDNGYSEDDSQSSNASGESDELGDETGQQSGDSDASGSSSDGAPVLDDDAKKQLQELLEKSLDELGDSDLGDVLKDILGQRDNREGFTREEAYAVNPVTEQSIKIGEVALTKQVMSASATTSALRNSLVRLLEEQTRTQRITSRKGKRLSRSKVHRMAQGDFRIFKHKFTERNEVSSDVCVLADYSSSMGVNIKDVQVATYALLDTLDRIEGANTSAYGFGGNGIVEIQKPNQGLDQKVKGKIFSLNAMGGTPAAEAYWAAVRAFSYMDAQKKVAIMVTDGAPNDPTATFNMVRTMRDHGMIVIGVGVAVDTHTIPTLNSVYGTSKWVHVKRFDDLPSELLRVAREVI